jgi:hypothetical protein
VSKGGGLNAPRMGELELETEPTDEEPGDETGDDGFWSQFHDEEDGSFDVGSWLGGGGVLPVALPITEPAVGVGLAVAVAYFHPRDEAAKPAPPSISFAGGVATDNGTTAGFGGHVGIWNDGKTRYIGAVFSADAELEIYGTGQGELAESLDWGIDLAGTFQQLKFAVADHAFLGAEYLFVSTESRFENDEQPVGKSEADSDLGGLGIVFSYDDRNTVFTPTSGLYTNATMMLHDEIFGSDFRYSRFNFDTFKYWDFDPFVVGLRFTSSGAGDGGPFYALPYLRMRGVPAFRYVGRYTALGEIEPVWRITPRWSALGFFAAGQATLELNDFGDVDTIAAGGVGFRYLIARKQGLGVGLDFARGPEESAIYFTMGSYWSGL